MAPGFGGSTSVYGFDTQAEASLPESNFSSSQSDSDSSQDSQSSSQSDSDSSQDSQSSSQSDSDSSHDSQSSSQSDSDSSQDSQSSSQSDSDSSQDSQSPSASSASESSQDEQSSPTSSGYFSIDQDPEHTLARQQSYSDLQRMVDESIGATEPLATAAADAEAKLRKAVADVKDCRLPFFEAQFIVEKLDTLEKVTKERDHAHQLALIGDYVASIWNAVWPVIKHKVKDSSVENVCLYWKELKAEEENGDPSDRSMEQTLEESLSFILENGGPALELDTVKRAIELYAERNTMFHGERAVDASGPDTAEMEELWSLEERQVLKRIIDLKPDAAKWCSTVHRRVRQAEGGPGAGFRQAGRKMVKKAIEVARMLAAKVTVR
ncbi:uncharacterized protein DSM5745_07585 [Aspergillus mulundensis]|uniref:Uncharacterized protein n=1 Tax=Aspergillus mulundensis TaxID=1810919 RepID=A0A3D8REB9_9EURO|nr:hypothetical protein DSM5745_07585 [Aspergillus mulundensis]RDW72413.1 hypothetical protein DSM5745_07585 [Aspergillus mulundensis]